MQSTIPEENSTTGTIIGAVIDSTDGSAVAYASISTSPPTSSVTAGVEGKYTIPHIPPGDYSIIATKHGYNSQGVRVAVSAGMTTTADVHLMPSVSSSYLVTPSLQASPADGLVAYYPFNGDAKDWSGFGHHGTVHGAQLVDDRLGNPKSAYLFDGVNDHIALPDGLDLIDTSFSISAWLKPNDYGAISPVSQSCHRFVLSYRYRSHAAGNSTNSGLRFGLNEGSGCDGTNHLSAAFFGPDFTAQGIAVGYEKNNTSWYHYALVREPSVMTLYLNGESVQRQNISEEQVYKNPAHVFSTIGAQRTSIWQAGVFPFDGIIDEVQIYNRALTDTEVQQLAIQAATNGVSINPQIQTPTYSPTNAFENQYQIDLLPGTIYLGDNTPTYKTNFEIQSITDIARIQVRMTVIDVVFPNEDGLPCRGDQCYYDYLYVTLPSLPVRGFCRLPPGR